MEINEDHPNGNRQRLFIQHLLWQGVSQRHLCLAETQGQAGQGESFIEETREGSIWALIGGYWPAEAGGGPPRNRASM